MHSALLFIKLWMQLGPDADASGPFYLYYFTIQGVIFIT